MQNKKLKIYVTLDALLENENPLYLINNELAVVNNLFVNSLEKISKNFSKLVDIVFISKEKDEKTSLYIKNLNLKFNYEFKYVSPKEILLLHNKLTKDYTLIDTNEELLMEWSRLNGKAIRYIDTKKPKKSFFELLEIKNDYETSNEYYTKLVNYIHLCH
jgi:hypothetical protein